MPGRPLLDKLCRLIEEWGGDAFILDQIADGKSISKIARAIEIPGHGVISRGMIYDWKKRGGEARAEGWRLAMHASGHAHAEDAGDILDELAGGLPPTAPEVQLARSRANYRQWLAGKRNEDYADKPKVSLELNVGALHLEALRKRGHMDAAPARVEIEAADYRLLEGGDDDEPD